MEDEDRYTRITLRIPRELHSRLDREADETSKSLNAEIIARLQASFAPAPAQDMFSTPDFQHRLKERALSERLQLINNQITTLRMHQNLLHLRLQSLGKDGDQDGLFDAKEQLADAEQNLPLLLAQREALLLESEQLDREYQDAVRPLNAKATALTEELLEPERRAVEDKLRRSNEKLGKLKPTRAELDAAYDAEVARARQVTDSIFGPDMRGGRVNTNAVTTGADDAPYKVTPTKAKRTQLVGNIGRLPPAEKPPAKAKTPSQRLREVATRPIRQNKSKKGL